MYYDPPIKFPHQDVRNLIWYCKDGSGIFIGDMTDSHLINAYKMFGDPALFKEMVVRLFELKVKETV
jgi:hypothetical protein